jgi:curved DNA-binding protein CbpA
MRDYYSILGVAKDSSIEEIKTAYRKLSHKFHPDKNDGDKFFEDRFKEIQSAYEVIGNAVKKKYYDESIGNKQNHNHKTYSPNPIIEEFKTDKSKIQSGGIVIITWRTTNADKIILSPFGDMPPQGSKSFRITKGDSPFFRIDLIAYNTKSKNIISKIINIPFTSESETNDDLKRVNKKSDDKNRKGKKISTLWIFYLIVASLIVIAINDDKKSNNIGYNSNSSPQNIYPIETGTNNYTKSITLELPKIELPKFEPLEISDLKLPELKFDTSLFTEIVSAQKESPFKGNSLTNGDSPLNNCFGEGRYGGDAWIEFSNDNKSDAIVCLVNVNTGRTIRNEYIKANNIYKMNRVPSGTYYLKVYYGNDWNPFKTNFCNGEGGFDTDEKYSKSDDPSDYINIKNTETSYSTYTITLYSVPMGNMSSEKINSSEFFKN